MKLAIQFSKRIHIAKLKELDDSDDESDSDGSDDSSEMCLTSLGSDDDKNQVHEQVQMLLSSYGSIYYVTSYEGQCTIKEIDPENDIEHHSALEI